MVQKTVEKWVLQEKCFLHTLWTAEGFATPNAKKPKPITWSEEVLLKSPPIPLFSPKATIQS